MSKTLFCAKNHLCHLPKYKGKKMTWEQVFKADPDYVVWVRNNLKGLRFATGLDNRIAEYERNKDDERAYAAERNMSPEESDAYD